MKKAIKKGPVLFLISFFALVCLCALTLQMRGGNNSSPQVFVQRFYEWYVPIALRDNKTAAWNIALKYKASLFDSTLFRALEEDSASQAKSRELVGLDFDPFLNSQDPSERYEVDGVTRKGKTYWVSIFRRDSGKRADKPDVIAELAETNGKWQFLNFHYPDGTDLLTQLKALRDDRNKAREGAPKRK